MSDQQTYRQSEEITVSQTLSIGRALQGAAPATAVIQHRRDHDCRYAWTDNGGVSDPPLQVVETPPLSVAGSLAVGPRDTVTLSVPGGTLPTGPYLVQMAVQHRGQRHVEPTSPHRILVVADG